MLFCNCWSCKLMVAFVLHDKPTRLVYKQYTHLCNVQQWLVFNCCCMKIPARLQNLSSLCATHDFSLVCNIRKQVSACSSSSLYFVLAGSLTRENNIFPFTLPCNRLVACFFFAQGVPIFKSCRSSVTSCTKLRSYALSVWSYRFGLHSK